MDFKHALKRLFVALCDRLELVAFNLVQILICADQLLGLFIGFLMHPTSKQLWADETMSARCGRLGHRYPYKFWRVVIDGIFQPFQGPNHCANAYEKEKARYNFPPEMRT